MATQVERAISWAKSKVGTGAYSGLCQAFVADAYAKGAGMPRKSASTANAACNLWRVSTSRSNIPAGAAVYFTSPTSPAAGHVGLYIGGNMVIHAFGKVKTMSIAAIEGAGYQYKGWGWNGGTKPTGAGNPVTTGEGEYAGSLQEDAVIHIPQTEQVWTVYETDHIRKGVDRYQYLWQSLDTGKTKDISSRVSSPTLEDDTESVCVGFSFSLAQSTKDQYLPPLRLQPGDLVGVINQTTGETVFFGQIQTMSGSYRDRMEYSCLDSGRLLTTNDIILQFNNCSAKEALRSVGQRTGLASFSCPNLVSSVYQVVKDNAATIAQDILETVTAENGVPYFLRVMGKTLVVRSFGGKPIRGYHKPAENLEAFDILDEASAPAGTWSIEDLRNDIQVYSDQDDKVTVLAQAKDDRSIQRYGRRTAMETYSDKAGVSASAKAKTVLALLNQVSEDLSLHCYGSDRIVAGVRLTLNLAEAQGDYWVTRVVHHLGPPHTMDLTLRRCD